MVDLIDPFATPSSTTPPMADMPPPDADAASAEADPNRPPEPRQEPEEETDEQWRLRFIEENQHLARARPERPPAPPPSPWDGPSSTWKVPDHLSLRHPKGGYMAMALLSRTMDDLDEITKGERAATYEEVDKYLGHALIAEGLVPFTYTADEAIRWWKAGGYRVLGGSPEAAPTPPPAASSASGAYMTNDSAADDTPEAQGDAPTRPPVYMNFNGMATDGVAIDNVIDPSQSGTGANTPASQQNPAVVQTSQPVAPATTAPAPASQPATPATAAPAAAGPAGTQATVQPAEPAKEAVKLAKPPISLGTIRVSANNIANLITDVYLPQNDFIHALKGGLLSSVEPDLTKASKDAKTPEQNRITGEKGRKSVPIANVDISADPDVIAFVHGIAPTLTAAAVKGKNPLVEKSIMVEWDSRVGGYVVTGIKILPAGGGGLGFSPRLPETLAALANKVRPRAFVIHTHVADSNWDEKPGAGDAMVLKEWLMPNIVVANNGSIHQVMMTAGELNPKNGTYKNPKFRVARILGNGTSNIIPSYTDMPR